MRKRLIPVLLVLVFALAACGREYDKGDAKKSSITVHSDGSVDCVLLREFAQTYYSEDELVSDTEEAIAAYNIAAGSEKIKLTDHQARDGLAALALSFGSAEDYDAFMGPELYLGTVQGAYDRGESFDQALSYAKKPERVIGKNDLMNMAGERILVVEGDMAVNLPMAPKYYTFGMLRTGENSLEATAEGIYFIIY
ncbi:MAG: hypothetical protein IK115_08995 [Lachnospiraceae bacterium]|nr:hypothetical protein [Lachnospiraceae bacterium]